ncbi:hypothetical protein [Ensifer sp. WSM1721]|uniref:hypothetical protein n=1 Tax=Ensifer sp. WSM1721 TaxID=1041159 RepID=UPI0012EBDA6A|nr:hypothetical protein [Ensifer sp. WSM1721]
MAVNDRTKERALGVAGVDTSNVEGTDDEANAGLRREPGIEAHKDIAPAPVMASFNEFDPNADEPERNVLSARALKRRMRQVARQASMGPNNGVEL